MVRKAKYTIWGENLDPAAITQMEDAAGLPIAVKGSLMPDAHKGYGLPIGGVLAVKDAVIPYAVGVDIACRMRMSVLSIGFKEFERHKSAFRKALQTCTRFGLGAAFSRPRHHGVLDEDWNISKTVKNLKDLAWNQLGSSGSGNHFAEFGKLALQKDDIGLKAGEYIALLTHSGSRGAGAKIADHFSSLAKKLHPELGKPLNNLAWLDFKSHEGQEYFNAMELMGRYASANHEIIHHTILKQLGETAAATIENHHNFAFKEKIGLRDVIVHRKGATPAGKGVLGVIPGSMADPGFVVRGKGNEDALNSASHGAGRKMSRSKAIKSFSFNDLHKILKQRQVTLISAGLDEIPMAYKNIQTVMAFQKDLVDIVARFDPKLVMMAPHKKQKNRR